VLEGHTKPVPSEWFATQWPVFIVTPYPRHFRQNLQKYQFHLDRNLQRGHCVKDYAAAKLFLRSDNLAFLDHYKSAIDFAYVTRLV
jgi:hypothetical protein